MTADAGRLVLFVVTSHGELGTTGKPTGYFLPEVTHPHRVFVNKGWDVDFVSPRGGRPPLDPGSAENADEISEAFLASEPWKAALDKSLRPDQVDPDRYDAIFFAGMCVMAYNVWRTVRGDTKSEAPRPATPMVSRDATAGSAS